MLLQAAARTAWRKCAPHNPFTSQDPSDGGGAGEKTLSRVPPIVGSRRISIWIPRKPGTRFGCFWEASEAIELPETGHEPGGGLPMRRM